MTNWRNNLAEILEAIKNPNTGLNTYEKYPKGRLETELIDNPNNFTPTQLGSDGYIYGVSQRGFGGDRIMRTNDSFETIENGPSFDGINTIGGYKTGHGFVVVGEDKSTGEGKVYFSETFDGQYTLVLTTEIVLSQTGISHFFPNYFDEKGLDICLVSEYSGVKDKPHGVYLSINGGQSWKRIFETDIVDSTTNSHIHTAVYDKYNGDIYVSNGDGSNRAFHRSVDLGETWEEISVPENKYGFVDMLQPTIIVPTPDKLFLGSDGQSAPGFYSLKKDIKNANYSGNDWTLEWEVRVREGFAGNDFPTQPYAEGNGEIYVSLPQKSGDNYRDYTIVGSGDNGNSWHMVYTTTYPRSFISSGLVGMDKEGYMYQYVRFSDLSQSFILKVKKTEWL